MGREDGSRRLNEPEGNKEEIRVVQLKLAWIVASDPSEREEEEVSTRRASPIAVLAKAFLYHGKLTGLLRKADVLHLVKRSQLK